MLAPCPTLLAGLYFLSETVMCLSSVIAGKSCLPVHELECQLSDAVLFAATDQNELPLQGCKHMYSKEGIKGMFQGNGTNCVRIVPNSAVKFLAYEQISRYSLHGLGHIYAALWLQHAGYSIAALHTMLSYLADSIGSSYCLQHQHQEQSWPPAPHDSGLSDLH